MTGEELRDELYQRIVNAQAKYRGSKTGVYRI